MTLQNTTLPIIPSPTSTKTGNGTFKLSGRTIIDAPVAAMDEAHILADRLQKIAHGTFPVQSNPTTGNIGSIRFVLENVSPPEGYHLVVDGSGVSIAAADTAGLFYGVQTLTQLVGAHGEIPHVEITDAPRFAYRGTMLDVSRHFMPLDFLFKFVDLLAMHKLNVLHLHLTDDQGWRIEIKKYPKLTEIGSKRSETLVGHCKSSPANPDFSEVVQQYDSTPHGGYYTQEDARSLVEYATARHVQIIPEIEVPGHAQAAIASYPEYGCIDAPLDVSTCWGIHPVLYNPSEATIGFLQDVLSEVLDIFPSKAIHIGGDEAVKEQWESSPEVQQRMHELGLANEHELQSYVIGRMDSFLTSKGRKMIGWDEIMEGGLSPNAIVMSWRGEKGGIAAATQGHNVVMAAQNRIYLDYYQSEDRDKEPLAIGGLTTLSSVYDFDIIPKELAPEHAHHILGAEAPIWTEYIVSPEHIEYMAFPRLCALAERAWSPLESKDYASFLKRLRAHLPRLDALGVNYRPLDN